MSAPTDLERDPRRTPLTSAPAAEGVDAAAAAARRVIAALLRAGKGSAADLDEVAGRLNEIADDLERDAPTSAERVPQMWRDLDVNRWDAATGAENAISPPLTLHGNEDGTVEGVVTLDLPYQGPPGHVHGGVSALLLDHTLGVANHWGGLIADGERGVTVELTLRYHRPVPLFEPLTVTGRQLSVDGRKIRSEGAISAGGRPCVTAAGFFIAKRLSA